MLPSLKWAILALCVSPSLAKRVEWEDLMFATGKFPKFFGEPISISRNGSAKVVGAMSLSDQVRHPIEVLGESGNIVFSVESGDKNWVPSKEMIVGSDILQHFAPDEFNDLRFTAQLVDVFDDVDRGESHRVSFVQDYLESKIPIDNTYAQVEFNETRNFTFPSEQQLYTGEFSNDTSEPDKSCDHLKARDTAEWAALDQPFWNLLYPAERSDLVYTVQDGRLYLTWRLLFDLKGEVGDDFIVWVNARNCSQIVAAVPWEMGFDMKTLEDFSDRRAQLFKDRKKRKSEDEEKSSKLAV